MSLSVETIGDVWKFDRLITIEWLMKILWELYDFKDKDLQLAIKRCYVLESATWKEVEKHPVQVVSVLMAFMRLLAERDFMLEEMIEAYVDHGIRDAFEKAEDYFEDLKRIYGESMFFQSLSLV